VHLIIAFLARSASKGCAHTHTCTHVDDSSVLPKSSVTYRSLHWWQTQKALCSQARTRAHTYTKTHTHTHIHPHTELRHKHLKEPSGSPVVLLLFRCPPCLKDSESKSTTWRLATYQAQGNRNAKMADSSVMCPSSSY
jgi:hypothetical protein